MTALEVIKAVDLNIDSIPESIKEYEYFSMLVSKDVANLILAHVKDMSGDSIIQKDSFNSGDKFKYKGLNFKVA